MSTNNMVELSEVELMIIRDSLESIGRWIQYEPLLQRYRDLSAKVQDALDSPPEVDDEDIDDEDIDDDDSLELRPVGTWPAYCEPCGKVQAFTRDPASLAMEDWECPTCKGGINL